jgi:hypothetical protein
MLLALHILLMMNSWKFILMDDDLILISCEIFMQIRILCPAAVQGI